MCIPRNLPVLLVLTNVGALCALLTALPSVVRAAPEDDLATFTSRLRAVSATLACAPEKNAWSLAEVGIAQVHLKDVKGALKTLKVTPVDSKAGTYDLVEQLAALQAATGDATGAFKTVASVPWEGWHVGQSRALLGIGRAAARAGQKVVAETAFTGAAAIAAHMGDGAYKHTVLFEIAMARVETGSAAEARKTFRELERLTDKFDEGNQTRAQALSSMGILSARLADRTAAKRYFAAALGAIDVQEFGGSSAHAAIAVAQADAGDLISGTLTALSISDTSPFSADRDRALHGLVLVRLARGDRARAEQTADEIEHLQQYHSAALLAIAQSYARAGEARRAIAVARRIKTASRKAQALLDVAAIVAQRGDKEVARRIADGITFLVSQDRLLRQLGRAQQFLFRDAQTWGRYYESTGEFTMASHRANKDTVGDLTAAAMRCRVVLDGHGGRIDREVAEGWDVRKVAKAQAAAGDAAGVLTWMDRLPAAQQLPALLGAADGLGLLLDDRGRLGQRQR
jgi:tetratricopeptide (TPR) repeat protein